MDLLSLPKSGTRKAIQNFLGNDIKKKQIMGYGMKYKKGSFPFKSPLHENDDDKYKESLKYSDLEKYDDDRG